MKYIFLLDVHCRLEEKEMIKFDGFRIFRISESGGL